MSTRRRSVRGSPVHMPRGSSGSARDAGRCWKKVRSSKCKGQRKRQRMKILAASLMMSVSLSAQWIHQPTPGIPRTADGKPNLAAPAPKTPDGKPDLSGLWLVQGLYIGGLARDIKEGAPFTPWAAELYK